jgi:hypothetical protein
MQPKRASETDESIAMEDWDYENMEVHEGHAAPRAVFSVRMTHRELAEIREAAEKSGKKTGEYIREAALLAAAGNSEGNDLESLMTLLHRTGMALVPVDIQASVPTLNQADVA